MDLERLHKNFDVMQDWQDRYRFIIDIGKKIEQVPPEQMTEKNRVHGCMSTVYMTIDRQSDNTIRFVAHSDAMIVNGLIAVLHIIYDGKTPDQIRAVNIEEIFTKLGLDKHISPNRRNGFFAMVERLNNLASKGSSC